MCGIFGVMNVKLPKEKAEICLERIRHRGPDAEGLWQEDGVTLGHRRLSVLDLSENGSQPMAYAGGRYEMVYNGEIYNFIEIRNELEQKGYHFQSDSDTEVVLAAFTEWKEGCLSRFNGMWAIAVWDRQEKKMFLSRDRFGVKPLYYAQLPGDAYRFAFASEMKALTPLLKEVRPNRKIVMNPDLMVHYEHTEECVIEGIRRFPQASYAYADENGMKITKFYETLDHIHPVPKAYNEQVEEFRELFLDACKVRMRSDVTIGTALSGGLDSSATICAMAHLAESDTDVRMNHDWQHAFVASFPGTALDETAFAKKVTDYLGIPSTFVEIDPLKMMDRFEDCLAMFEDVYVTSPIPMMMLYGALREHGTLVTIDGHGADELFGGYTFDFLHALDDAESRADRSLILSAYMDSFPKDDSNTALHMSAGQILRKHYRRKITGRLRGSFVRPEASSNPKFKKLDHLNRVLYASSHENILPTLLRNYDRYSMANGVEIRMPFMDYRIVEYAFSIGWRSKLHGGYSKSIIRDAMAPFMPEEIAYRKSKIGFNTPIVEWMQGPMKEYFLDIVHSSGFSSCTLLEPEKVRRQVENVISGSHVSFAEGESAFRSLYPYLWQRAVIDRAGGSA